MSNFDEQFLVSIWVGIFSCYFLLIGFGDTGGETELWDLQRGYNARTSFSFWGLESCFWFLCGWGEWDGLAICSSCGLAFLAYWGCLYSWCWVTCLGFVKLASHLGLAWLVGVKRTFIGAEA